MAEKNATSFHPGVSQAQQQAQQSMDAWQKLYVELESKMFEQARANIDEMARLMKESVNYAAQLSAEWRRLFQGAKA